MNNEFLIFGTGISGIAAAKLLLKEGARVLVASANPVDDDVRHELEGAAFFVGNPADAPAYFRTHIAPEGGIAVLSPGIPLDAAEPAACRAHGIAVTGEFALGASRFKNRMIAITGSKGKSSLVKLVADTLSLSGHSATACGNYGVALCDVAARAEQPEFAVTECSSFQLETTDETFRPDIAVLLNLSPDHLDRHGTMETYRDTKLNIFAGMRADGLALLPDDFERHTDVPTNTFGTSENADWQYADGIVTHTAQNVRIDVSGSYFDNAVLGAAAAAACAVLTQCGLSPAQIEAGFRAFAPLPHRMQRVGERNGVTFVNNSKATSVAAMFASVKMAKPPVFLIAGGRAKEKFSQNAKEFVTFGVKKAYLIGECMQAMEAAWSPELPIACCGTLENAVGCAFSDAQSCGGGTVLLAPGAASFDQFRNFEARGEQFSLLARALIENA